MDDKTKKNILYRIQKVLKDNNHSVGTYSRIYKENSAKFYQMEHRNTIINVQTLYALCQNLQVSADYILFGQDKENDLSIVTIDYCNIENKSFTVSSRALKDEKNIIAYMIEDNAVDHFRIGDTVIIKKNDFVEGEIHLLYLNERYYLRRVVYQVNSKGFKCFADNKNHSEFIIPDDSVIIGRVVASFHSEVPGVRYW